MAVPGAGDDLPGGVAQAVGGARRKPGRGSPTLSMSCSNKIARWTCLGLQVCGPLPPAVYPWIPPHAG